MEWTPVIIAGAVALIVALMFGGGDSQTFYIDNSSIINSTSSSSNWSYSDYFDNPSLNISGDVRHNSLQLPTGLAVTKATQNNTADWLIDLINIPAGLDLDGTDDVTKSSILGYKYLNSSNATTCGASEYSYFDGTGFQCRADQTGGAAADSTGGWTNDTLKTSTTLAVVVPNITTGAVFVNGGVGLGNSSYYKTQVCDFLGTSQTAPFMTTAVSSGTFASFAGGTWSPNHPGVVSLRDSTTAGGGYAIGTTSTTDMLLQGGECAKLIFYDVADRLGAVIKFGFLDSYTVATSPTDACFFYINSNTNQLGAECRNNSVVNATMSNYTISNTQWYRAEVCIVNNLNATFNLYNSDTGALVWGRNITREIPVASASRHTGFAVFAGQNSTDAAANIAVLDYMELSINRRLNR
jgi:hypothetical protein